MKSSSTRQNPSGRAKQNATTMREQQARRDLAAGTLNGAARLPNVRDDFLYQDPIISAGYGNMRNQGRPSAHAWSSAHDPKRPVVMAVDPPQSAFIGADQSQVVHPFAEGQYSQTVDADLRRLMGDDGKYVLSGHNWTVTEEEALKSEFVRTTLTQWGYDPDKYREYTGAKRSKLAKRLLNIVKTLEHKRDAKITEHDQLARLRDAMEHDIEDASRRMTGPLKLERPQGSSLHHLAEYLRQQGANEDRQNVADILANKYQSFVIEHDWAAAFKGSTDFDQGEFPFPYDWTCFEFRINGMRVLLPFAKTEDGTTLGMLITGINGRWYVNEAKLLFVGGKLLADGGTLSQSGMTTPPDTMLDLLGSQIRAVCIMLDAGVAQREVVRVSERLNSIREKKGKAPLRDYHVVSLARRSRAIPDDYHTVTPGNRKRLHFRRGHWRHYPEYRLWIKWQLVGDPDLGFVDKHYKL